MAVVAAGVVVAAVTVGTDRPGTSPRPFIDKDEPAAPASLAVPLLVPSDLGSDWYAGLRPQAVVEKPTGGERSRVATSITRQHRDAHEWSLLSVVSETRSTYPTASQAAVSGPLFTTADGIAVRGRLNDNPGGETGSYALAFALGADRYSLSLTARPAAVEGIVRTAVRRAVTLGG